MLETLRGFLPAWLFALIVIILAGGLAGVTAFLAGGDTAVIVAAVLGTILGPGVWSAKTITGSPTTPTPPGGDAMNAPKLLDHVDVRMYEDGTSQVQFGPDFGRARAESTIAILIHTLAADETPGPSDQLLAEVRDLCGRHGVRP